MWPGFATPIFLGAPTPTVSAIGGDVANLGKKGDVYVARFRYGGKEYKKSLKTTRKAD
jgi:hypothetical protein